MRFAELTDSFREEYAILERRVHKKLERTAVFGGKPERGVFFSEHADGARRGVATDLGGEIGELPMETRKKKAVVCLQIGAPALCISARGKKLALDGSMAGWRHR